MSLLKFSEYLERIELEFSSGETLLNENRNFRGGRSAPGGAFGNKMKRNPPPSTGGGVWAPKDRSTHKDRDFADRVAYGKSIEDKIYQALVDEYGWRIRKPTAAEDMGVGYRPSGQTKIDGLVMQTDKQINLQAFGGPGASIQIKYRDDPKDDILVETVKPWTPELSKSFTSAKDFIFLGRDIVSTAKIYACLNFAGNMIRIRSADEAKDMAKHLAWNLMQQYRINPTRNSYRDNHGEARIVANKDSPGGLGKKIVAFLRPDAFSFKADYPLRESVKF